ncbi:MAG: hypothetical protein FK734_01165 [Asgard group archaeon]|nr:hypothetical protein [Asgard group archaeon]
MSYLFDEMKAKEGEISQVEDKVLLMGLQQAGKTAIKDVVFFGKEAGDVEDYMATIHYERQFIDEDQQNLVIDAGGQESYWNEAVTHFRHLVFSNVKLLLWILDMTRPDQFEESERRFSFTIRQFKKENPNGHIAVLCHKVDQIPPEELVSRLEQVKTEFSDPKYNIRFEPSSIYYPDSLKELIFALMKDAKMNVKRFELITNIGQKVEESEEFQSYVVDHQDDPRIKQLLDFLHPESSTVLPTYGKTSLAVDLSDHGIVEIVLIDKETLSPITGASSNHSVSIDKSMDYIIALKEFKEIVQEKRANGDSKISIVTASNNKVHGMIVSLETKFMLITTFHEITDEKTKEFYNIIKAFAQSGEAELVVTVPEETAIETKVVAPTAPQVTPKPPPRREPVEPIKPLIKADETSIFSFVNKMKEIQDKRLEEPEPIVEPPTPELIEPIVAEEVIQEELTPPTITEELEIKIQPEELPITPPTIVEEANMEPEKIEPEPVIEIAEKPIEVKTEEPIVVVEESITLTPQEPVPKQSAFMKRIQKESKQYQIRQIEVVEKKGEEEKIDIGEENISSFIKFLKKEKEIIAERNEGDSNS